MQDAVPTVTITDAPILASTATTINNNDDDDGYAEVSDHGGETVNPVCPPSLFHSIAFSLHRTMFN